MDVLCGRTVPTGSGQPRHDDVVPAEDPFRPGRDKSIHIIQPVGLRGQPEMETLAIMKCLKEIQWDSPIYRQDNGNRCGDAAAAGTFARQTGYVGQVTLRLGTQDGRWAIQSLDVDPSDDPASRFTSLVLPFTSPDLINDRLAKRVVNPENWYTDTLPWLLKSDAALTHLS